MRRHFLLQALSTTFVLSLAAAGCAVASSDPKEEGLGADKIAPFDDPEHIISNLSRKLVDNITEADIGQTFGVPDALVPYPDTYWPMDQDGINMRWNNDEPSPLEKYVSLTGIDKRKAERWNSDHAGKDVPGVQSWFGICQGWTGAAINEAPMLHGVNARIEDGKVTKCTPGEDKCVSFEIGDLNALMATIYADGRSGFVGARCDTKPADIVRDADGRIHRTENGAGCKGLNPGALMFVLSHRLKRDQKPFAIDAQNEANTEQIWNQPAYRYTVNRFERLQQEEAANLVVSGRKTGPETGYRWNADARGWVFVDVTVHWVTELGPNTSFVSGLQSTKQTRMTAVVELDRPADDAEATIIGGELTQDSTADTNRLKNHPFVWVSLGPGPENLDENATRGHNPHIKVSVVQQLMALGRE